MDNLGNTCALRKACLSCDGFPMVAAGRRCSGEFHSNGTVGVKGPEICNYFFRRQIVRGEGKHSVVCSVWSVVSSVHSAFSVLFTL